jgi:hypothetical protein
MLLFTLVKYFFWPMLKDSLEKRKSTKTQSNMLTFVSLWLKSNSMMVISFANHAAK